MAVQLSVYELLRSKKEDVFLLVLQRSDITSDNYPRIISRFSPTVDLRKLTDQQLRNLDLIFSSSLGLFSKQQRIELSQNIVRLIQFDLSSLMSIVIPREVSLHGEIELGWNVVVNCDHQLLIDLLRRTEVKLNQQQIEYLAYRQSRLPIELRIVDQRYYRMLSKYGLLINILNWLRIDYQKAFGMIIPDTERNLIKYFVLNKDRYHQPFNPDDYRTWSDGLIIEKLGFVPSYTSRQSLEKKYLELSD